MSESTPRSRATLKDVARVAGYHFTTVSLALRGHPSIPECTRARIAEVAQQLGYERDPVFSALSDLHLKRPARTNSPRLAFVINYGFDNDGNLYPYLQAILDGAHQQAARLGYELEQLVVGEDDHDSHSLEQHLKATGTAGVILAAFQPGFSEVAISWENYAVVKVNAGHMEPHATTVSNDQLRDVRLAFRKMNELGYRRIGLAIGRADEDAARRRHTAGFLLEQTHLPSEQRVPPLIFPYTYDMATVSGFIGRWARRHRLDAVLCNWGNADRLLTHAGFRVPEEIGCACLCIARRATHMAGVCPNLGLVGERAVTLIATQLKSGEIGVPEFAPVTYVESVWKDGSTAPRRVA